jgi:two-component system chemotaxis response regulator CheY
MGKRILIVDDSPLILAASKHALKEAGYDVETRNGPEDVGAKGADGFDLILMDVQMPELFGDDVASVLKHQRAVRAPIYLFSTLPDDELSERVRDAKVDGFISKGAGIDHLLAEVRRILGD